MTIPLLSYAPSSQNHRVDGFEIPGDEQPHIYNTDSGLSGGDLDMLITSAYRQIYNEQQMLDRNRQTVLESQLRGSQITVQEFIRGLLLSDSFRRLTYDCNNNYRFVEICIQRILGRTVYGDRETFAWSIVLATKGLQGFVDELLNSDEYQNNFGSTRVPYQRRRILPQRDQGDITFAHMARYGADYRDKLPKPQPVRGRSQLDYLRWDWQKNPPKMLEMLWIALFFGGMSFFALLSLAAFFGF